MFYFNESDIEKKLDELIASKFETEVTEFKEAKNSFSFDELGRYFSALSNEANLHNKECAWLVFGVEDKNHIIVGTSYRTNDKDLNSLKEEIAKQTTENLSFIEIYKCYRKDPEGKDKRILLFQIPFRYTSIYQFFITFFTICFSSIYFIRIIYKIIIL